jgi:hypothetical protein
MNYHGYSYQKAKEVLNIFTDEQMVVMEQSLETGG